MTMVTVRGLDGLRSQADDRREMRLDPDRTRYYYYYYCYYLITGRVACVEVTPPPRRASRRMGASPRAYARTV